MKVATLRLAGGWLLPMLAAALLSLVNLRAALPVAEWWPAVVAPDGQQIAEMVFHYSLLPRLTLSLLVGAGLGLAGLLFQQVLRNPLAEPATLGVASGAQLGMTAAALWALPGGAASAPLAAMAGALLVGACVFGIAWGRRLSPVTLILAGLVLSLYCSAVNQILALFHHDQLQSLFLWSTGSLNQIDWQNVRLLAPRLALAGLVALALLRPLTLMGLDDGVAKNLGLSLSLMRLLTLLLAIALSAQLVSAVGIIGFIGLFAPLMTRMLGARRLPARLLLTPLFGATLLWLADQVVWWLAARGITLSTGTLTALIGAPLLLGLLPRLRTGSVPPALAAGDRVPVERRRPLLWLTLGALTLTAAIAVALTFGRGPTGWVWASGELWQQLLPWRAPRVMAALAAGVMLALAGCLIQRLTANPMASPEVLGISSGAAFGVVVLMLLLPGDVSAWQLPAGTLGGLITLLVIVTVASRGGFSPQRMLLAGTGLTTAFTALLMLLLASGDPRMAGLLTWLSGSTWHMTDAGARHALLLALAGLLLAPLCRRWLTLLPLGDVTARSLGVALTPTRLLLFGLAALLTAGATLTVGPLSFIGLMAPHMARMLGFRRALPQLFIAACLGGGIMLVADWCGRMLAFPDQIPAGLLATFIGAPWFVWLLRRG
ncbi:Fe(3+)-hydroxamate ABC transporter permease FhuB [Pantoea sp. 1.19]|uniref:Fe(3+)-hydroxamate ABC transporter permease FhuB n=1 Tax=Pantoea sp. 1.19 TaxID=1925589 RepID=UPI000948A791|nr:Fe(3+)-hydroxamate ABC transporter permease FhuB [Pantoea sp. 1.19]